MIWRGETSWFVLYTVKKKVFKGSCWKLNRPHDLVALRTTFNRNNLKLLFSVWLHHSLVIVVEEFFFLYFTMLLHFIDVCRHSFLHSCLKASPKHFNQIEVWTQAGPLQHLYSFHFQLFCYRFVGSLTCCMTQGQDLAKAIESIGVLGVLQHPLYQMVEIIAWPCFYSLNNKKNHSQMM